MNLFAYINRHVRWSNNTFGRTIDKQTRVSGNLDHLQLEILEVRSCPSDIEEWADVIILAIEGCTRQGFTAHEICNALDRKQSKNQQRNWPTEIVEGSPQLHIEYDEKPIL